MVAAKRKTSKDKEPQPMLALGWDPPPEPAETDEPAPEEADEKEATPVPEPEPEPNAPFAEDENLRILEEPASAPVEDEFVAAPVEDEAVAEEEALGEEEPEPLLAASVVPPAEEEPVVDEEPPPPPPRRRPQVDSGQGSVGERLRVAREQADLTVERVAEETCLRTTFIEDLENGNYAALMPLAFSRSYVRRLCEMYCLPEAGIVKDFVREYEAKRGSAEQRQTAFHMAPDGDDGTSKVVYVPSTVTDERREGRSVTVGSVVAGVMVLVAVALSVTTVMLAVRQFRGEKASPVLEEAASPPTGKPNPGQSAPPAPVDLRRLILPEELPLDELPIPK